MESSISSPMSEVTRATDLSPCYNTTREEQVLDMLHYVHAFFASLSVFGSLSVIVYAMVRKVVKTSEIRPLFHLAIADLGLALCWLVGAILWNIPFDGVGSVGFRVCTVLQAVTEMFNVISFFLTVNYALNVYLRLKDRHNRAKKLTLLHTMTSMKWIMRLFYVISWLLPIAVMTPVVVVHNRLRAQDPCTECLVLFFKPSVQGNNGSFESWSWAHYGAIFFVVSLLLSMVSIVTFYVLSAIVYRKLMKGNVWTNKQRRALVELCKRISFYIAAFVICWIPALVLNVMDLFCKDGVSLITFDWLYVLQGVTAPSQGFLNCIVYGWTRTTFRMAKSPQDMRPILKQSYRVYGTARFPRIPTSRQQAPSIASDFSDDTSTGGAPMSNMEVPSP
ncbi:transmembrane protein 116-like [Patiria miniata]|uniref:G-protein coupled receptors family 1 profile domain-containing protein n=1 Tax=Patiria miniata TaxID=46514 RepID=A0A914A806_PATMI|nr:transmembrane protein 116-like [Patiria miniata]XP_038059564.1 transmembrane protein 116-like [Patiria miniata]